MGKIKFWKVAYVNYEFLKGPPTSCPILTLRLTFLPFKLFIKLNKFVILGNKRLKWNPSMIDWVFVLAASCATTDGKQTVAAQHGFELSVSLFVYLSKIATFKAKYLNILTKQLENKLHFSFIMWVCPTTFINGFLPLFEYVKFFISKSACCKDKKSINPLSRFLHKIKASLVTTDAI